MADTLNEHKNEFDDYFRQRDKQILGRTGIEINWEVIMHPISV